MDLSHTQKKIPMRIQIWKIDTPEPVEKEFHSPEQQSPYILSCGQSKQVSTHRRDQITCYICLRDTGSQIHSLKLSHSKAKG